MKKHTTLKSKFNSAFSLVELLVVIAVIAIIAAIAIPNIAGTRQAAQGASDDYRDATVERFQKQLSAMGDTRTHTLADFQTGVTFQVGAEMMTFKLD